MTKGVKLAAAAAFLATATWLFIWPAFGPYIDFVLPLPGTSEIQSVNAYVDHTGKPKLTVNYFFKGRPVNSRFQIAFTVGTGEDAKQVINTGWVGSPVRGTHNAQIILDRPWGAGTTDLAFATNAIEVKLIAPEEQVIATKKVDFKINWPDRKTYELDQLFATTSTDQIFKKAQGLIQSNTTRSLLEANTLLRRLVRKEPNSTQAVEQLVFIESVAPWGLKGSEKIDSRKEMFDVVNALINEDAYNELDRLGDALRESKALTSDGFPKLRLFHKSVSGEDFTFQGRDGTSLSIERSGTKWSQHSPQSHIPKLIDAKKLMRQAWQVRGNGYASSVSKQDFERFHDLIKQSVVLLSNCRSECKHDPEWYATLLMGLRQASVNRAVLAPVFVEGFTKFPWYQPIYWQMATAYSPKWGGSNRQVESFANELALKFPATDRDAVYSNLYNILIENGESFYDYDVTKTDFNCVRGVNGHKALVDKWATKHNLNVAAKVARSCGDKPATRMFLKQVDNAIDVSVWTLDDFTKASAWAQ
jgi:hypothetical protein